jgi:branched-chain amino acid transport system substrate-binding protein
VQQKAITLALDELNRDRKWVSVIYEDSQLDPAKALTAAERLVSVSKVNVLFTFSSGETLAVAGLAKRSGILQVAPMASSIELDRVGDNLIRLAPSDAAQAEELAKVVGQLGHKSAAIIHVNDVWGKGLAQAFERSFAAAGGTVVANELCEPGATDFRAQLTKIKSQSPEVLFLPVHPDEALPILRQAKDMGLKSQVFGGDTFSNQAVYADKSGLANGVIFALPAESDTEAWRSFASLYKSRYGTQPDINAAAAYDAVKVVARAASTAGSYRGTDLRKSIIAEVKDYEGATGRFSFSPAGIAVDKRYSVFVVKAGAYKPFEVPRPSEGGRSNG